MIHSKCVFAENRDSSYFGHDWMGQTPSSCHTPNICLKEAVIRQVQVQLTTRYMLAGESNSHDRFRRHVSVNCSRAIMEFALLVRFFNNSEALCTLE